MGAAHQNISLSMKKSPINKALCKLDKNDIEKQMDALMNLVAEPRYICQKCARVAAL